MKQLLLLLLSFPVLLLAVPNNVFIIKDKHGKVLKDKKISHRENAFLQEQARILNELKKLEEKKSLNSIDTILAELNAIEKNKKTSGTYSKSHILTNAKKHLGENYVWGGTTPNAFDCSGYVQYIYKQEGVSLPRTALQQSEVGQVIKNTKNLEEGDLLFFLTDKKRGIPVTHVGIYLGQDKFIHAASKRRGIIISSLSKSRYKRLLVKATRIIQ